MSTTPLADRLTRRWVRAYTRRLSVDARKTRRSEVESDLWEHREDARERGLGRTMAALEITGRVLAGMPADIAWRQSHLQGARGVRHAARIEGRSMQTITTPKQGFPGWLAVLAFVMGGFAALMGLGAAIDGGTDVDGWGLALLVVGAAMLSSLWLVNRAPLASLIVLACTGLGFAFLTYWMVVTIFCGIAVAGGAVLSAPRVLRGSRPVA